MAEGSIIAWTTNTFNPWLGCSKVSQGCRNCYALTLTKNRMGRDVFGAVGKRQRTGREIWQKPRRWNRQAAEAQTPDRVFCASLADVFEDAPGPNEWRHDVWQLVRETPWLDWQILTKRPENIARMLPDDWDAGPHGYWPNVWLGTSIEDNRVAQRGPVLTAVPAIVHFVSYEPAIGPLDRLELGGIDWMIVGGESGPGYRAMDLEWAREMQRRCADADVAYFFKQDSAPRTEQGIDALGAVYRDYPKGWDRSDLGRAARPVLPQDRAPAQPLTLGI